MDPFDENFVQEYREILRRAGLRATHARLIVAQFLVRTSEGVTIGDVLRGVNSIQMDRVTVTRILRAFSQAGFVVFRKLPDRELQIEAQESLRAKKEQQSKFHDSESMTSSVSSCNCKRKNQ